MTRQEEKELAQRLAAGSEVFDFETALAFVRAKPAKAEKLLRRREENKKRWEERARARERRKLALRELL